jgi:hypothetical protein
MLTAFTMEVALSPEGLRQPSESGNGAEGLADKFREARLGVVTVSFSSGAAMAYSSHDQSPFLPGDGVLLATVDLACSSHDQFPFLPKPSRDDAGRELPREKWRGRERVGLERHRERSGGWRGRGREKWRTWTARRGREKWRAAAAVGTQRGREKWTRGWD